LPVVQGQVDLAHRRSRIVATQRHARMTHAAKTARHQCKSSRFRFPGRNFHGFL
jgi:hypothetical protein